MKVFDKILIEPTNICNLKCPLCPTGNSSSDRPKGTMNISQFKKVLNPIIGNLKNVLLCNFGEPFLAPDVFKMIEFVNENNISLNINTNGMLLNKNKIEQFRDFRPDLRVMFSIDGATKKTYEDYRKGGNFKKVLQNVGFLADLKKNHKLSNIRIVWQFIIMKGNKHEVNKAKELAENIGVDEIRFRTLYVNRNHSLYNKFVPEDERNLGLKNIKKKVGIDKIKDYGELIDIKRPVVLWNGDVLPCCMDTHSKYVMGSALSENILEIWRKPTYIEFRRSIKNGTNELWDRLIGSVRGIKTYPKVISFKD